MPISGRQEPGEHPALRLESSSIVGNALRAVFRLFGIKIVRSGHLLVGTGENAVSVQTPGHHPVEVWLTTKSCNTPACSNSHDWTSVELHPHSFTIYTNVVSESLDIHWYAVCK